jgi:integrase
MPLTAAKLESLKPGSTRYTVTDRNGLAIEVFPTGGMGWRFRYQREGRTEKVSLGKYPEISLKDARQRRDELAVAVAKGGSPAQEKRLAKREGDLSQTVGEFLEVYFQEQIAPRWKDPTPMRRFIDKEICPAVGHRLVKDVSVEDVQRLVHTKKNHGFPVAAAELRNLLRRFFAYAIERSLCTSNPAQSVSLKYIQRSRPRRRALSDAEIGVFLRAVKQSAIRTQFKLALPLILLTLTRKSELLLARWADVDFDKDEWRIPPENSKNGHEHIVYLGSHAKQLLLELQWLASGSELVMPGRSSLKKPFAKNALNAALDTLTCEIPRFTLHDLRRTASTRLHELGYMPDVVEASLNHLPSGIRAVYNVARYEKQRREMMQAWGEHVTTLSGARNP